MARGKLRYEVEFPVWQSVFVPHWTTSTWRFPVFPSRTHSFAEIPFWLLGTFFWNRICLSFAIHTQTSSHSFDMTPPSSSTDDDLQEIRLDDNAHAELQCRSTRPVCLCGPVHEILLVIVAAFIGATFLTLHRGTIVITDSIKHSLSMDTSSTSWIPAGSGLTAGVFLLPLAHIADRCPALSRKTLLLGSLFLFALVTGLITLCRDGIVLDVMLGLAGILAAAQLPVISSLLTSVYSVPSTRRHCVFTFVLAGGNSIAVVFGGIGSGLTATYTRDWRASFVYIAIMFGIVLVIAVFTIPNLRKAAPFPENMADGPEEQYALLASGTRGAVEKHEMRGD